MTGTAFADSNGIRLAYETFGARDDPPVVLIMGLSRQMIGWPTRFCELLAQRGLFVVRFDNRDIGESTHLDLPTPNLQACMAGDTSTAPYDLGDMAHDTAGLLDQLELPSAHLVGASMGGMIAQVLAGRAPERVLSLTSIMSTSGDRSAAEPTREAAALLVRRAPRSRDEAIELALQSDDVLGSPGFERDREAIAATAGRAWDRGHNSRGVARQIAAIFASGDRTAELASIRAPTLVVHGEADPLIPVGGGRATAAAIEGAELVVIEGMGHDLPPGLWPRLVDLIAGHVEAAEAQRQAAPAA